MSFDSRGFSDRNSQYFNKPTRTWGGDGKAMGRQCSKTGTAAAFRGRGVSDIGFSLASPSGGGQKGKVARAFNKVLRFFSRAAARRRSLGMSNGCHEIACRFTHEANFLAYRDAIFLPFLPDVLLHREHRRIALISPLRAPSLRELLIHSLCFASRLPSSRCEGALPCPNLRLSEMYAVTRLLVSAPRRP